MTIKANGATKTIKMIKVEKASGAVEAEARAKRGVNSKIRISIIIFIMRRSLAKRASTRK